MKLSELSPSVIERIRTRRYDQILEKHEGPERWSSVFDHYNPEFLEIGGHAVLLPIGRDRHANITPLRCIVGEDGQVLTLFLKDTTYVPDPEDEAFYAGRIAICERMDGESFFLATVYHEWFIIE